MMDHIEVINISAQCVHDFMWDHTTDQLLGLVITPVENIVIVLPPALLTGYILTPFGNTNSEKKKDNSQ